jgi:phosphoribosylformylglycinamidine synthase
MIFFFKSAASFYAVHAVAHLDSITIEKLCWLFGDAGFISTSELEGEFIGPRREMLTPWSTNAVEITQNMGIQGIKRIEEFVKADTSSSFDPMLQAKYHNLDQEVFTVNKQPEPIVSISNIAEYNLKEGLSLNEEEIDYLEGISRKIGRPLTDSEVFGFSQVNSEHCRHKIFNGTFIIDEKQMSASLFGMIKKTSERNPNQLVSAYKDNVAFVQGPTIEQFAPATQDKPDFFQIKDIHSVISLKAETHNFPTTVEPFNGAATGSGGEIRDRMAGGKGSLPIAGTAVYMTSYPQLQANNPWEQAMPPRKWLYQTPEEILIKASNGASDFGNKFGQPLICGSVLTFEHSENNKNIAYDKVIMQAGGIGFARKQDSLKDDPKAGDKIIVLGGDNYRIGMGGGAVSSVATGEYKNSIELNAVQRSNPEMQKRVFNAIRALAEMDVNPAITIHDHGAGGHLNCLSELVEATGGKIEINKLPVGDPTLSAKEIIGNESQERMGLILKEKDVDLLNKIAERERAPMYVVGETTGDHKFTFEDTTTGAKPMDLKMEDMFGKPPKTIIRDKTVNENFVPIIYDEKLLNKYLENILQLEAVACKDWLTNKVDRSVTGRVALQQTAGKIQLPLNNLGAVALDYQGIKGIATSLGHAPVAALVNPEAGSRLSLAEALTNIVFAPVEGGLEGISLSANWMWPCKNEGEDARLYKAVQALSEFAIALGINIPTGKDSLSMTQKYPDGETVLAPGTVIISAVGEISNIRKIIKPVLQNVAGSGLIYINFSGNNFCLGGSSFAQTLNTVGNQVPDVKDALYFKNCFNAIQQMIANDQIIAGHDISAGGLITTLLEMNFANTITGMDVDLTTLGNADIIQKLFSENPGVVLQVKNADEVCLFLKSHGISHAVIGKPSDKRNLTIQDHETTYHFDIDHLRDTWYHTSYLLDGKQCSGNHANERFQNYKKQNLKFKFNDNFTGKASQFGIDLHRRQTTGIRAAIIREKGVNGDREMAYSLYLAGFDVKDVHMTDLISGRENLEDISMIVFVGGFSNSDVLGSAKGWAGAFLYNPTAKQALDNFYKRNDTLSLGVCNGCQLMVELDLINPDHDKKTRMLHNASHKFESAFLNVDVLENNAVMLRSFAGNRLGIWVAHGEGRFSFPYPEGNYHIPVKYSYSEYPGNPNGSDFAAAAICSADGRHLAIMPHLERALFPWNWAEYPVDRKNDEVSPWVEAFVNAREWIKRLTNDDC